jgi:hypothetical protein
VEGRLEEVRLLDVAALGVERFVRREREGAATPGVEQAPEDARRVDIRQTEPVDRAVEADERRRAAVSDQPVVADR